MITIMLSDLSRFLESLSQSRFRLAQGEALFRKDDAVLALHVLRIGEVHVVRHGVSGNRLILQRAGPGSVVSEPSVHSERYHCDAVAICQTEGYSIPRALFVVSMAENPAMASLWTRHLAREAQKARSKAELLTLKTVSERLDAWLDLNDAALPTRGKWQEIASEIGVSREALYREIATRRKQDRATDS